MKRTKAFTNQIHNNLLQPKPRKMLLKPLTENKHKPTAIRTAAANNPKACVNGNLQTSYFQKLPKPSHELQWKIKSQTETWLAQAEMANEITTQI